MRWRREDLNITMASKTLLIYIILTLSSLQTCTGVRRAQRRKDTAGELLVPAPSAESLTAIAAAMGAAGFEDYTEGKRTLVKRLIPSSQAELDIVEHLGVIGKANVDFPALPNIPNTGFNCKNVPTGYYADLETDCQVFHICDTSRKISFLCPNGTIFSQSHLICDWWFKVDCASAPALYEASVEYYSNEQKKSQRINNLRKNPEPLQIGGDSNIRAESKRTPVTVPSTTERLLRHRQKLQSDTVPPNAPATARSYQTLFDISTTQRTAATAFEKRRKNLVQLIANNFGNPPSRTTLPLFESSTHKSTIPAYDHNSLREMQEAAETASFAQNQNRQYLQEYNSKNFRPYPVYTPNLAASPPKAKSNPTLTTLYDIQAKHVPHYVEEATTKRQTLVPYTKSYVSTINERREPYTRPGVSLLRDFLEKEKNKSISATTEKFIEVTARSDKLESKTNPENKLKNVETKDSFESVTKIPQTTRNEKIAAYTKDVYTNFNPTTVTTEQSYQQRRDRLQRKLSTDIKDVSEPTVDTTRTEKYYGDQTNRPGLVVSPSISPKTLHSLAIYYATALDNLSTTPPPEDDETTTPAFDMYEPIEQSLPDLFSRHTITKYSNLFGRNSDKAQLEEIKLDPNSTYNELAEDLIEQMSQGPLATSPQIRELAQVFTHALSAYLQDPVRFRKVLSDIRPTHPSFSEMLTSNDDAANTEPTTTVNEDDEEILGFSDDHRGIDYKFSDNSVRGGKALNIATDYPTTVEDIATTTTTTTTEVPSSSYYPATFRNPFRCCGRISASYTTAPTTRDYYSTVNGKTVQVNLQATNQNTNPPTTDIYTHIRNEKIQNPKFVSRFGKPNNVFDVTPPNDYTEFTTFPTAWGSESIDSTLAPITNSHQMFESKKIRPTTGVTESTPVYFTETDSIDSVELENEEELQRAHSQSFVSPQGNSVRQGKQLKDEQKPVKKPAQDLEAPTQSVIDTTTNTEQILTTQPTTTTLRDQTEALTTVSPISSSVFTSPDIEKSTSDFQWPTTFGNWHSTVLDPITLNDGLSVTGPDQDVSEIAQQTNGWALDTATTPITYSTTTEPTVSSTTNIEIATSDKPNERFGKILRESTSTEPAQDLSTVTDTIVEKAKEIMEGMNATTTQKLMNVMKKTKSKSVKRLILLLVQTCDDDHNSTAEASKKALLEALMAVSPKDMDEIAKEEETNDTTVTIPDTEIVRTTLMQRRSDRIPMQSRRGKSLNVDVEAINSLSNPTTTVQPTATTESLKTEQTEYTTTEYTTINTVRPTTPSRRGGRRFKPKTTEVEQTSTTIVDRPIAEARLSAQSDLKPQSDTRALELLRSLYTIAARWG